MGSTRRLIRSVVRGSSSPQSPGPVTLRTAPEIYAEAVHRAVCEFTGTDGFGHCQIYTLAGYGLLTVAKPPHGTPHPQAGALYLNPDPADTECWHVFDPEGSGIKRGEFHSWVAFDSGVFVDFAARHYARYSDEIRHHSGIMGQGEGCTLYALDSTARAGWNRPDPPVVLWGSPATFPEWVRLAADRDACRDLCDIVQEQTRDVVIPLCRLAWRHFTQLGGVAETPR